MSEPAPEAPGRAGPRSSGPKSGLPEFLTRKIGGFPVWVYAAVLGGLLLWRYQSSKKAATSTSSTPATTTGTDTSQVPQYVNQTYTSTTAPSAPGSQPGVPLTTEAPPTTTGTAGPVTLTGAEQAASDAAAAVRAAGGSVAQQQLAVEQVNSGIPVSVGPLAGSNYVGNGTQLPAGTIVPQVTGRAMPTSAAAHAAHVAHEEHLAHLAHLAATKKLRGPG